MYKPSLADAGILIVDGDARVRDLASRAFMEFTGSRPREASNGLEALSVLTDPDSCSSPSRYGAAAARLPLLGWALLLGGLALIGLSLTGCAVGPDFERPAAPVVTGYTPDPFNSTAAAPIAGGEAQRFIADRDIPGEWWTLFRSPELDALIAQAIKANPTLDAAKAALHQARENYYAAEGAIIPTIQGNLSATRQKFSGAAFGNPALTNIFSVGNAALSVSYPLDIFGGVRRRIETVEAQTEFQQFQLTATYLTLTSNVVTTAVDEASLKAQIAATQQIVDLQANQSKVLRQQFELGGAAGVAVLAQDAALAQSRAVLPPLEKRLAQARNRLAALAGRFPSEQAGVSFELANLKLPEDLPVSLPSKLVEQRPDIRASEAQLHVASAGIGIATANMLPQITLNGSFGSVASPPGNLLSAGSSVWSLGGSIAQTLLDSGSLIHQRHAAIAAYDEAAAQYRGVVLQAFQDVANALRALQSDADAVAAGLAAERAAAQSLDVTKQQYELGAQNYVALLTAQQTYQQAKINLVQAQANRFSDTAVLFQALGGGWWNDGALKAVASDDN